MTPKFPPVLCCLLVLPLLFACSDPADDPVLPDASMDAADASSDDADPPDASDPDVDTPDTSDSGADSDAPPAVTCPGATLCGDTEIVVDEPWLSEHLMDSDLQIVDTRSQAAYQAAHIPGAVVVDVGTLRTTVGGIGGQVVDTATAEGVFSAAGLRRDAAIVVYGDVTDTTPARLVWTLEHFGHERVAMLDGGFSTWDDRAGATITGDEPPIEESDYTIDAIDPERRVDVDFISPRLTDGSLSLVDARSTAEFDSGRIPRALNVDWNTNVQEGTLIDEAPLAALYEQLETDTSVVAYCQTGSRASVTYVVLRHLGFTDVRLYDGSWSEWGSRSDLPREP